MIDSLKDFKIDEISSWLKDYINFIIKPRIVINGIFNKSTEEITRQFLFYFLIYTSSFLFLSLGTSISEWIRPAVLNLFRSIPITVLFFISTKFFNKKYAISKIIAYVIGVHFVTIPILILVFATFLTTENYTYKYLADIFSALITIYLIINFGFAIEEKKGQALKISIISYLILNLLYFAFERINVDPYSTSNFNDTDSIYNEYYELVNPIKNKEVVPTSRLVTVYKNEIKTYLTMSNIITDTISQSNDSLNNTYLKEINKNIKHIKGVRDKIKFRRNKEIASIWLEYLENLKYETEFKYKDTLQINKLNPKPLDIEEINKIGAKAYIISADILEIMKTQIPLKSYHNSILKNHKNSTVVSEFIHKILFLLGYSLDYIIGDLILKEGEPKEYRELFLELE